jgi:hypothetical protein
MPTITVKLDRSIVTVEEIIEGADDEAVTMAALRRFYDSGAAPRAGAAVCAAAAAVPSSSR